MSECCCPSEGGSFGHVGEGEGDHFAVGVVDFLVDKEVEAYCVQPLDRLMIGPIKGIWCSDTEFCGFRRGHWRRRSGECQGRKRCVG